MAFVATACIQPSGSGTKSSGVNSQSSAPVTVAAPIQGLLSDTPQYNYGTSLVGSSAPYLSHIFTLSNIGSTPITNIIATINDTAVPKVFRFVGGVYPGTGGTCTFALLLAPGALCTLSVEFQPLAPIGYTAQLQLSYAGGGHAQSQSRQLLGTGGVAATLVSSPVTPTVFASLPAIPAGPSGQQIFSITNLGSVAATITSITVTGNPVFVQNVANGTCIVPPATTGIVGGAACTIEVDFNAPVPAAITNATMTIIYNDGLLLHDGLGGHPAPLTIALQASSVLAADHLIFNLVANPPSNPPSTIGLNTNFSATVQAVDIGGTPTNYFSGTIQITDANQGADFGAVNSTHGLLVNNSVAMANGVAAVSNLQATAPGYFTLHATVTASPWLALTPAPLTTLYEPPIAGAPAVTHAHDSSTIIAAALLDTTSAFYQTPMWAYLPFDAGFAFAAGHGIGTPIFTPNFGFRAGPWVAATMGGTPDATLPYQKNGVMLSEHSSLVYPTGANQDFRYVGTAENIDLTHGTVSFWFKPGWNGTDTTPRKLIYVSGLNGSPVIKTKGDGKLYAGLLGISPNPEEDISVDITGWAASSWHQIVYRWDSVSSLHTGNARSALTVDNVTTDGRTTLWAANNLATGFSINVATAAAGGFSAGGVIASFRLDDRTWSDSDITASYNGGHTGATTGVRDIFDANTKFAIPGALGSVEAVRAYQTGNGVMGPASMTATGTLKVANASSFNIAPGNEYIWIAGAGAVHLNGVASEYLSSANNLAWNGGATGDFTFETWIRIAGPNTAGAGGTAISQTIIHRLNTCSAGLSGGYSFIARTDGRLASFVCGTSSASGITWVSNKAINDGLWHHVAMVVNQSSFTVSTVIDGIQDISVPIPNLGAVQTAGPTAYLGGNPATGETLNGDLDETRLWSVARSVQQLSNSRSRFLLCNSGLQLRFGYDDAPVSPVPGKMAVVRGVGGGVIAAQLKLAYVGAALHLTLQEDGGAGFATIYDVDVTLSSVSQALAMVNSNINWSATVLSPFDGAVLMTDLDLINAYQSTFTTPLTLTGQRTFGDSCAAWGVSEAMGPGGATSTIKQVSSGMVDTPFKAPNLAANQRVTRMQSTGAVIGGAGTDTIAISAIGNAALYSTMSLFPPGGYAFNVQPISGVPTNLVAGGDFEQGLSAFLPTYDGVLSAASFMDSGPLALTGTSLHVVTDNLCTGGSTLTCPHNGYGGVYVDATYLTGLPVPAYLLSFDYKLLLNGVANNTHSLNLNLGGGNVGGYDFVARNALDGGGFTNPSSPAKDHVETVYYNDPAHDLNILYFTTQSAAGEFMLDNVKVLPLLVGVDFENGMGGLGNSCGGSMAITGTQAHSGINSLKGNMCAAGTGLTTSIFNVTSGNWYTASAWVMVQQGSGYQFQIFDTDNGLVNASQTLPMQAAFGAGGAWARVSTVFQASGNHAQLSFTSIDNASVIFLDDIAVYQVAPVTPSSTLPQGAKVHLGPAGVLGGTTDSCAMPASGGANEGVVSCSKTIGAAGTADTLGAGTTCPANAPLNAPCSNGTPPSGGSTVDGAILVDGTATFTLPASNLIGTDWTVSMWVKPRKAQAGTDFGRDSPPILGINPGAAGFFADANSFDLWSLSTGVRSLLCASGNAFCSPALHSPLDAGWDSNTDVAGALPAGTWTNLTIVYDGLAKTGKLYKNGVTAGASTINGGAGFVAGFATSISLGSIDATFSLSPSVGTAPDYIRGLEYSFENFDGWIDNFRTFNRKLTTTVGTVQGEVQAICNIEKPPTGVTCGP